MNKNNKMNNEMVCNYHITLRNGEGRLIDWKGYETYDDAVSEYIDLIYYVNEITDGSFVAVSEGVLNFVNEDGVSIAIEKTSGNLLMEILFKNDRMVEELFSNYFADKKSLA